MTKKDLKKYFENKKELQKLGEECSKMDSNSIEYMEKECKIYELQDLVLDIDVVIDYLNEDEKKLIDLKFVKKVSNKELSFLYKFDVSTIGRKINKIVNKIGDYVCKTKV